MDIDNSPIGGGVFVPWFSFAVGILGVIAIVLFMSSMDRWGAIGGRLTGQIAVRTNYDILRKVNETKVSARCTGVQSNSVPRTTSRIRSFASSGGIYEHFELLESNCKTVHALVLTMIENKETSK